MQPAIILKNVSKKFIEPGAQDLMAVKDISLEVGRGEFFVFVGPSGSGKSTILRIMSGLEKDFTGELKLEDGLVPNDFSFVFQQFALFPWLTAYQNIEMPLIARNMSETERRHKVQAQLAKLRLEHVGHLHPREMSGGMRQRVGIARALVTDPKVIFMDEPFSELDSFTAEELRQETLSIWQAEKRTIIMVTHIVSEAIELADRIAVLTPRPGKIEKIVHNHLTRPRQKRSPEFFALEDELMGLIKP